MTLSNLPRPGGQHHSRGSGSMSYGGVGSLDGGGSRGGGGAGGGSMDTSKHLLEIEVVGLKRRVWAAESKQECRRWVSFS